MKHLFNKSPYFDKEAFQRALWGTKYQDASIEYYHESLLNWSDSKGEKKADWIAAAKNWMLKDIMNNKFITNGEYQKRITESNGQPNGTSAARIVALKSWGRTGEGH